MRRAVVGRGALTHLAGRQPCELAARPRFAPCRRAGLLAVTLLVLLVLGFIGGCKGGGGSDAASPQAPLVAEQGGASSRGDAAPGTHSNQVSQPGNLIPTVVATVTEVIDGDTFCARLGNGREEKVRLIGVDTPESTKEVEPYGKEAAAYTEKRLSGRTVYLELDVGGRDKYGRLLAYVWLEPPQSGSEA